MAEIIPFRGILYNTLRVSGDDVIAPPYDIITPEMRETLYSRSPYNIARIDAGMELEGNGKPKNKHTNKYTDKYIRSRGYLDEWLRDGILTRGRRPAFYVYRMQYEINGKQKSLTGFFGLLRLVELGGAAASSGKGAAALGGKDGVYPHEETHSKPKHDRLALLEVSGTNTSPIFSLYNSPRGGTSGILAKVTASPPFMLATDTEGVEGAEGTVHSLWPIEDEALTARIKAELQGKAVYIADGHHRYETALDYQRAMRQKAAARAKPLGQEGPLEQEKPFDYVLMFLANIADEELTILPTHRLLSIGNSILEKLSGYMMMRRGR